MLSTSAPTSTGLRAWKISSCAPTRTFERSWAPLISRAFSTASRTMLWTLPMAIPESKKSRKISLTPRYGLRQTRVRPRANCLSHCFVTGSWKRTFSSSGVGSKASLRAQSAFAACLYRNFLLTSFSSASWVIGSLRASARTARSLRSVGPRRAAGELFLREVSSFRRGLSIRLAIIFVPPDSRCLQPFHRKELFYFISKNIPHTSVTLK